MSSTNQHEQQEKDQSSMQYKMKRAMGLVDHGVSMSKEEMGDYLHWFSLLVSIIFGIICGLVPLTGSMGILTYLAVSRIASTKYVSMILGLDVEEMGGAMTVAMEGIAPSSATFLLVWIFAYSLRTGSF